MRDGLFPFVFHLFPWLRMTVTIHKMAMFHTPKSQDELLNYIERFNGSEKVVAMVVMGMTWNMIAELIAQGQAEPADANLFTPTTS